MEAWNRLDRHEGGTALMPIQSTRQWLLVQLEEMLSDARKDFGRCTPRKVYDPAGWRAECEMACLRVSDAILLVEQAPEEPRK